jgi:hypothetical protein
MRPLTVTVGPLAAASANAICLSQTPNAGNLTLNGALVSGGVATLDNPRRVLITTAGNESAKTFTITGTNYNGLGQSETLTGPNVGTVQSVLDYKTITSVSISANAAGAVTVGTSDVASSPWVRFDDYAPSLVSIQCTVSGSVTYSVQQTLQDPNSPTDPVAATALTWINTSDTAAVNAKASLQTSYQYAPTFARITTTAGAGSTGSVTAIFTQFGVVPL